jgi:protein gp138
VPIVIPRAGIYSLTLPIAVGDECLVVFGDMDIGAWWDAGAANKAQNQIHERRHTLADGFALLGISSQPRVLNDYSTTSAQLRTEDGATYVDLASGQITLGNGVVTTDNLAVGTGWTGTYATGDGRVVTVVSGIVMGCA